MATVEGLAAIEDCEAGIGACPLNCGSPSCDNNSYRCAYANYPECAGAPDCSPIPSLPRAGGCDSTINFSTPCLVGGFVSRIWDCGPCDNQFSTGGYCNDGTSRKIIACMTSRQFRDMCSGCNPFLWGLTQTFQ